MTLMCVTNFYQIKIYDQSDKINLNWTSITDRPYGILIIGGSGSGKSNMLLNVIKKLTTRLTTRSNSIN